MMTEPNFKAGGGLDARLQAFLGRRLRQEYDGFVAQTLPEQVTSLLNELARREADNGHTTDRPA